MPKVNVNDITINYEKQGAGEPLILIPYLAADNACYAFQVADYAKHFTCISSIRAAQARPTSRTGPIRRSSSPTTSPTSCTIRDRKAHVGGLYARRGGRASGSRANTLSGSSRCPSTAPGRRATHS